VEAVAKLEIPANVADSWGEEGKTDSEDVLESKPKPLPFLVQTSWTVKRQDLLLQDCCVFVPGTVVGAAVPPLIRIWIGAGLLCRNTAAAVVLSDSFSTVSFRVFQLPSVEL
jgi:hypothetical protein